MDKALRKQQTFCRLNPRPHSFAMTQISRLYSHGVELNGGGTSVHYKNGDASAKCRLAKNAGDRQRDHRDNHSVPTIMEINLRSRSVTSQVRQRIQLCRDMCIKGTRIPMSSPVSNHMLDASCLPFANPAQTLHAARCIWKRSCAIFRRLRCSFQRRLNAT